MPHGLSTELKNLVARLRIDCVIVSTEPQAHKAYCLWAMDAMLDIIVDKPITARKHVVTDMTEACGIAQDYDDLLSAYKKLQKRRRTICLIASHRRYHPAHTGPF